MKVKIPYNKMPNRGIVEDTKITNENILNKCRYKFTNQEKPSNNIEWNGNDKCNKKQWIRNSTPDNILNEISPNNVLHVYIVSH